jgi:hypothetical protein
MKNVIELTYFYNAGFGWICRQCEGELDQVASAGPGRIMREGEGEYSLSTQALARWLDPSERTLICPRCGSVETLDVR